MRQSLEAFADGCRVTAATARTRLIPEQVVARAESMLGRPYDGVRWNCDHFVAYALGNKIESPQLTVAAVSLATLALAALAR